MYWQKMADQMAERVVAVQNAAEKSDSGSDCGLLVTDPLLGRLLRLESDSCEPDSVDLTWKYKFHQTDLYCHPALTEHFVLKF